MCASFGALLVASGGEVLAPRLEIDVELVARPSAGSAFTSGDEKQGAGISPTGEFRFVRLVDPSVRGSRWLRSHSLYAADWSVDIVHDDAGPLHRNILEHAVLELLMKTNHWWRTTESNRQRHPNAPPQYCEGSTFRELLQKWTLQNGRGPALKPGTVR
jgi:hypothetical protein